MAHNKRLQPRTLVALPDDFSPTTNHPICLWLGGGDGGPVRRNQCTMLQKIVPPGFIGIQLPLFKYEADPNEVHRGLMIGAFDDYPLIRQCYETMLSPVFDAIPAVDPQRSVMGGFSNGAHTTALLLSAVDPFILSHFGGFYLLDGGFKLLSLHKKAVQAKRLIHFVGGSRQTKQRRNLLDLARSQHALSDHPDFTLVEMPGVKHAFPDAHVPQLQAWMTAPPA